MTECFFNGFKYVYYPTTLFAPGILRITKWLNPKHNVSVIPKTTMNLTSGWRMIPDSEIEVTTRTGACII